MSKNQKPKTEPAAAPVVIVAEAAAAPVADPPAPGAAPAPAAAPPATATTAASSRPAAFARRVQDLVQTRMAGSRAERLLKRAREAKAALPRRLEGELDTLLGRVGLVRKSRTQGPAVGQEPATKAA